MSRPPKTERRGFAKRRDKTHTRRQGMMKVHLTGKTRLV